MKKVLHTVLLALALPVTGCVREAVPFTEGPGISLTVRCTDPSQTKADTQTRDGNASFNENLIKSVDFLFYPGENPGVEADAVYHIRKELSKDPMQPGVWEASFNLVVKREVIEQIFTSQNNNRATVYALVNFDNAFIDNLSHSSRADLAEKRIVKNFAELEQGYIQDQFLMDGKAVMTYYEDKDPNVSADIMVSRFASKLTFALNVAERVQLKHVPSTQEPDETWTPVLHTARVYLVNGLKSVLLTSDGTLPDATPEDPNPEYFSYSSTATRRPFVRDSGTPYLETETVGDKLYYHTYPMYSYPATWDYNDWNPATVDYSQNPQEPPYFKLEMDWRREPDDHYSYDRRKYYYKVYLPFEQLKRNNWYGFYLDVSILGSETDEGKAVLEPTCYLLDWQNKSLAINKYAVISKARYLSVDKQNWDINNVEQLSIPFTSSHNVTVVPGSVTATRPYFGKITTDQPVGSYHKNLHGWICDNGDGTYYLDYTNQPEGNEKWEPSKWLSNTSTSIVLKHPLANDNTKANFDYSVYTIKFKIVHTDLVDSPESYTYAQYVRDISIVQRPGIYIESLRNSDDQIVRRNPKETTERGLFGYPTGEEPWTDYPWGYVYVNGGRYIRHETKAHSGTQANEDRYFKLDASNRPEYQWQTVWYTGGSRDIYDIHATVLPSNSTYVIGDPRTDRVDNLTDEKRYAGLYIFEVGGSNPQKRLDDLIVLESSRPQEDYPDGRRVGFNSADALYGESPRPLKWYYPTERSTRTENMVAPSYRISSKFSGIEFSPDLTQPYAEYRCAAFQEDGFPAGRWRLPTKAEVSFIAQLSAMGFFEFLFNNGSVYWSANGAIKINGNKVEDSSNKNALLRCVYDSWYWDKIDGLEGDPRHNPRNHFVWGDKER